MSILDEKVRMSLPSPLSISSLRILTPTVLVSHDKNSSSFRSVEALFVSTPQTASDPRSSFTISPSLTVFLRFDLGTAHLEKIAVQFAEENSSSQSSSSSQSALPTISVYIATLSSPPSLSLLSEFNNARGGFHHDNSLSKYKQVNTFSSQRGISHYLKVEVTATNQVVALPALLKGPYILLSATPSFVVVFAFSFFLFQSCFASPLLLQILRLRYSESL